MRNLFSLLILVVSINTFAGDIHLDGEHRNLNFDLRLDEVEGTKVKIYYDQIYYYFKCLTKSTVSISPNGNLVPYCYGGERKRVKREKIVIDISKSSFKRDGISQVINITTSFKERRDNRKQVEIKVIEGLQDKIYAGNPWHLIGTIYKFKPVSEDRSINQSNIKLKEAQGIDSGFSTGSSAVSN